MTKPKYHLEIESDPNNLILVEEFVNYFSRDLKLSEEKISNLLLAVTEAATNAIVHANKSDKSKKVKIDVYTNKSSIKIKVKDEGEGFDPGEIPDPTEPENLLKDSGRGIFLMRFYADDLQFNKTPTGMETILTIEI